MKIETAAKLYILLLALTNCGSILGLISINKPVLYLPLHLSYWVWNAILLLAYLVLPILTVVMDNYFSYMALAGVSISRIIVELAWTIGYSIISMPLLYALATFLSFYLAVENVASKVAGEILSLSWSQF